MPTAHQGEVKYMWQRQADGALAQNNPVSGQWYTILNTVEDARVYSISAMVVWSVQPTPLNVRVTIDGIAITFTIANPASGTVYAAIPNGLNDNTAQVLSVTGYEIYRSFLLEGQSILIEANITGGTVSVLYGVAKYGRLLQT